MDDSGNNNAKTPFILWVLSLLLIYISGNWLLEYTRSGIVTSYMGGRVAATSSGMLAQVQIVVIGGLGVSLLIHCLLSHYKWRK